MLRYAFFGSPLGWIGILASPRGLAAVTVPRRAKKEVIAELLEMQPDATRAIANPIIVRTQRALAKYFAGDADGFARLPLDFSRGTKFQQRVWKLLRTIPRGETRTYGQIARTVGRPSAYRAVGQCNARNPWAIVVPCHRLVGARGELTGYGGGIEIKKKLLEHEGVISNRSKGYAHRH
jgi:methylated-DNA-[protein]-cysteine S-methyltransferase